MGFHGFAVQPGQRTVAGTLCDAIGQVLDERPRLTCAGRTDTGVHALAQVVHVDLEGPRLEERFALPMRAGEEIPGLARSLTGLCGPGVEVWRAVIAPPGFEARHAATGRRYHYDLELGERADPLRRNRVWHVGGEIDLSVVRMASDPLLGEHDFSAFCRRPPDNASGPITRKVVDARWTIPGDRLLRFEIEAGAFCHQMVRSLVGALVAAGQGRKRPSDIVALLRSGSRLGAPPLAPARGLCLVAVRYPAELGGDWC